MSVDPCTYLMGMLQRIDTHPANDVALPTPRLWKETFAADPLRSHIDRPWPIQSSSSCQDSGG
jgi:transposase